MFAKPHLTVSSYVPKVVQMSGSCRLNCKNLHELSVSTQFLPSHGLVNLADL